MTSAHNESHNIGAVGDHIAAAQQRLPFAAMEAAAGHIASAGPAAAEIGADSTQLQEVSGYINVAQQKLGQATTAITAGHDLLSEYTASIGVASEPPLQISGHKAGGAAIHEENTTAITYERGNGKYIATERTISETTFRVVMARHTVMNAAEITAAMGECEVVAMESVGYRNSDERAAREVELTHILQADRDPKEARLLLYANADLFELILLEPHIGKGTVVKLLDIDQDNPDYALIHRADAAADKIDDAIDALRPLAEARAAADIAITADLESIASRDAAVRTQLAAIAKEAGNATVGVMVGAMHPGALTATRSPSGETIEDLKEQLWKRGGYGANMAPIAPASMKRSEVVDRMLLHKYIRASGVQMDADPEIIATLIGPRKLANVLNVIDETIQDNEKYPTASDKFEYLNIFLAAVVEIVQDDTSNSQ